MVRRCTGLSEACGKGESRRDKNGSQCFHLQFLMGLAFDTAQVTARDLTQAEFAEGDTDNYPGHCVHHSRHEVAWPGLAAEQFIIAALRDGAPA